MPVLAALARCRICRASTVLIVARWRILFIVACLLAARLRAQGGPSESTMCDGLATRATVSTMRPVVQASIDAKPGTAAGAFLKGCLAMADDKADKAADFFETATKLEPARALYYAWLGRAFGDQAQNANKLRQPFLARKTKAAFERAIELDPNDLEARNYLVQYYQMAPGILGGSEQKATEQGEAIRVRNPYRGGFVMANVKTRRKDLAGAAQEMKQLTVSSPDSMAPWYSLVQMQSNLKQWDDAFRTVSTLRAAHPRTAAPDYLLGRLAALSSRELDAGEAALRRYLTASLLPGDAPLANAHWRLGQILLLRGATPAARAELQEAVRLAPNLKEAQAALAALK